MQPPAPWCPGSCRDVLPPPGSPKPQPPFRARLPLPSPPGAGGGRPTTPLGFRRLPSAGAALVPPRAGTAGPSLVMATGAAARGPAAITTLPSWLTSLGEEETVAYDMDSSSSMEPHSATPPALSPSTTGYKKVKKARATPAPTHPTPQGTNPGGTVAPVPWDPSRVMSKCLLAILLLALVAATFMVCTGVLGARLWRRSRTAHRRLSPTEMVCISSLLPDGEVAANGPKPGPARRQKPLLDGGSEADGDNLTLSSFLPEHA
uniref:P-selectin glycoprotein ligand 1 n=1 Tax=Otus sunia TaxID=257818 RepID=A0A8C8BLE2_9STRI